MQALSGITILDLTHMLSGPYGTMLLTDMGARTIKVEPPGAGEGTRQLLQKDPQYSRSGMGAYFLTLNRGKESIGIDLKTDAGLAVFHDLVRVADIVFDNFSAGVTQRLGIDHDTLSAINPRIITCSVTGFGQTGPDNQRPAFDQVVQAMGGGMSITGMPGQAPVRAGIPIGDLGGGLFGALGVLAALQARHTTGLGSHVDISMLDAQISLLNYMATMHLMSGSVPGRIGNAHFVHVPYNLYPTQDGYIIIACIGDSFFERIRALIPRPELQDPAYLSQPARFAARELIDTILSEELSKESSAVWLDRLRAARIPCGPVNDFAAALSDPQVRARHMVIDIPLGNGDTVQAPGNPVKISSADDTHSANPPPSVGQHSDAILTSLLGYSMTSIQTLRTQGAIQ